MSTIVTNKRQLLLQMNINICQLYILYIVQWTELLIIFLLTSIQCILGDPKQKQKLNKFSFCLQLNTFLNIAAIHSLQNVQHIPPTSLLATELQTLKFIFNIYKKKNQVSTKVCPEVEYKSFFCCTSPPPPQTTVQYSHR